MITKAAIGRRVDILLPGVPTQEIKVIGIDEEEIIGEYSDGEEIHLRKSQIMAYWYPKRKEVSPETKAKIKAAKQKAKHAKDQGSTISKRIRQTPKEKEKVNPE